MMRYLFVPVWPLLLVCFFLMAAGPWLYSFATSSSRSGWDWFRASAVAACLTGFLYYYFIVRLKRLRGMFAKLHGLGYRERSPEDPEVVSTMRRLCPSPFDPSLRKVLSYSDGRSVRLLAEGHTLYNRDWPHRENIMEDWTYFIELRRLPVQGDIYIFPWASRKIGSFREMKDLSEGLSREFSREACACAAIVEGAMVPEALQEFIVNAKGMSEAAFLGTYYLRLSPEGWGFCSFPMHSPVWMDRLFHFADRISESLK